METHTAFITALELAAHLRLPLAWVKRSAEQGIIPSLQVGNRRLFALQAVRDALRTQQTNDPTGGRCMGTAPGAQKEFPMNDILIEFACLERALGGYRLEAATWAKLNLRAMGVEVQHQQIPKKGQRGQRGAAFAAWLQARSRGDAKGMGAAVKALKGLGVIVEDLAAMPTGRQAGRTMARQGSLPQPDGAGMSSKPRRIAPPGRTR